MATFATGAGHGLAYQIESTFGVAPAPDYTYARITGTTIDLNKDSFQSDELRSDQQIADFRHGNKQVSGDINFEISHLAFDWMLEAVTGGTYAAKETVVSTDIAVDATARTFTNTGSFDWDDAAGLDVKVGDYVSFSGFTEAGNNVTVQVLSVSATVLTATTATTGLVTEVAGDSVTATAEKQKLKCSTGQSSFQIERQFTDINQYQVFSGCTFNTMSLNVVPNSIVTGTASIVGKDMTTAQTPADATITAAPTGSPMDAFNGEVLIQGGTGGFLTETAIAVITAIDFNLERGMDPTFVVGSDTTAGIVPGRNNVSGTITAFFENLDMYNLFLNETEASVKFQLKDGQDNSGEEYLEFHMPRVKFGTGNIPVDGEGAVTISMSFQALLDSTEGTNLIITRSSDA